MEIKLNNPGDADRLFKLGCSVRVEEGALYVPIGGLLVAAAGAVLHAFRVRKLRRFWLMERRCDRLFHVRHEAFWETYMVTRYRCREVLPNVWFCL